MLVEYKTVVETTMLGTIETYVLLPSTPCCGAMSKMLGEDVVTFAERDWQDAHGPKLQVSYAEDGWEGELERSFYPIDFCPWCGQGVVAREAQRVRKVRKVNKVVTETERVSYEEVPVERG